ncbi:MAG: HAD family phosphatase [Acetatifactor sp.]|nr:HAD family phosphatase [Acetatifactor sp.]
MIKNIIFDIGNVLADFRWKEFLFDKGFDEAMVNRIARASVLTPAWYEVDRGIQDMDKVMQGFINNDPEIEKELHRAFDDIHGMVTIRDYAIPWLKELKEKGYGLYYLSNYSEKAEKECADSLAFMPLMDGGILSYKVKCIKPDPEIYRLLLKQCNIKAEESVFIDDTLVNVEAAKAFGIAGIHFQTIEQVREELRQLICMN